MNTLLYAIIIIIIINIAHQSVVAQRANVAAAAAAAINSISRGRPACCTCDTHVQPTLEVGVSLKVDSYLLDGKLYHTQTSWWQFKKQVKWTGCKRAATWQAGFVWSSQLGLMNGLTGWRHLNTMSWLRWTNYGDQEGKKSTERERDTNSRIYI